MTGGFPAQMASNAENLPFDDVTMSWTLAMIISGHGLSPSRHQAAWNYADFLSIGPARTKFSEIWIKIQNHFDENVFEDVDHFIRAPMF